MKRRAFVVLLSLLLAAVTVASLLFTSVRSKNRFRPIPAHAHLVYNNESPDWFLSFFPTLGSREPRQAQNFPRFGKNKDESSNLWKKVSKPQRSWFQTLENCPLAVATVSFSGRNRRDAWVAVSELGGSTALFFRWRLLLFPPEGVSRVRPYAAWPVWRVEHPSFPSWARVYFTLTDGLLICSISDDSRDIHRLLDTLDGRAASLADRRNP